MKKAMMATVLASGALWAQPGFATFQEERSGAVTSFAFARPAGQEVKGAPYSAEWVTETVQTLADGNRIVHKNKSSFARDGAGRTRREMRVGTFGPLGRAEEPLTTVMIDDAVARTMYSLDPKAKTFTKSRVAAMGNGEWTAADGATFGIRVGGPESGVTLAGSPGETVVESVVIEKVRDREVQPGSPAHNVRRDHVERESLGERNFDGVMAKGARTTLIIPAGEAGNEKPIEVVTESWYSEQLKTMVYSRHYDPRFGETTTKLENVRVGEPSAHLFTVPADYKEQRPQIMERKIMVRDEL